MKKIGYLILIVALYFVIRAFTRKSPQTGYLEEMVNKNIKKIADYDKKIVKLNKKKVNKNDFKDYTRTKLINYIKSRLKSRHK